MEITKEIKDLLLPGERLICPNDAALQYTGRIDFDDPTVPVLVNPYTSVRLKFTGARLRVLLRSRHNYWKNYVGVVIDGRQDKVLIGDGDAALGLTLAEHLPDSEHDAIFFKRMDACHYIELLGFTVDEGAQVRAPEPKPTRRMEIFGDSVSAGEISEAVDYVGKKDPEDNDGRFSNAWYSYGAITARRLNAQLHDVAQGGIALMHGTGWFNAPNYIGIEETYDKIEYNPALGPSKPWDFSRYTPHVVVIAIGQNDSHPDDYMKDDYGSARSQKWRTRYEHFVRLIREIYPQALIVLATTILNHDENWDRSIGEVCKKIGDERIVHFLYSNNGHGTPGHIRIPEAEQMANELSAFIESFGENIWHAFE